MPRKPKLPPGLQLLEDIKTVGMEIPEELSERISKITDEQALVEFKNAGFDSVLKPSELTALNASAKWMMQKLEINPILMTCHIYTIGHARKFIQHAEQIANGLEPDGTPYDHGIYNVDHRLGGVRMGLFGTDALSKMLLRASKEAQTVQPLKEKKKPKNQPPDTLGKGSTLVQNNGGTVVIEAAASDIEHDAKSSE